MPDAFSMPIAHRVENLRQEKRNEWCRIKSEDWRSVTGASVPKRPILSSAPSQTVKLLNVLSNALSEEISKEFSEELAAEPLRCLSGGLGFCERGD
jgi:hypothetical protein